MLSPAACTLSAASVSSCTPVHPPTDPHPPLLMQLPSDTHPELSAPVCKGPFPSFNSPFFGLITGALCAFAYMENIMRKKTKGGRREMQAPRETGGEERGSAMARRETGGKRWKNHSRCRGGIRGDPRRMLQSVSISSISGLRGAVAGGMEGEGGREELGGEADDVKRFELFRRPLHHM